MANFYNVPGGKMLNCRIAYILWVAFWTSRRVHATFREEAIPKISVLLAHRITMKVELDFEDLVNLTEVIERNNWRGHSRSVTFGLTRHFDDRRFLLLMKNAFDNFSLA